MNIILFINKNKILTYFLKKKNQKKVHFIQEKI